MKSVFVPVSRARAMTRATLWLALATVIAVFSWPAVANLRFDRSGISPPIVDIAVVLVVIPFGLCGVGMVIWGLRWFVLAVWPGRVGVHAQRYRQVAVVDADREHDVRPLR